MESKNSNKGSAKKSTSTNDYKKPLKKTRHVGEDEFEETRSDNIRMKPQPFDKSEKES